MKKRGKRRKKLPTVESVIAKKRDAARLREDWHALRWRVILLAAVLIVLLTRVFLITQVVGQGMYPAMEDGDLVIAFRLQLDELTKKDVAVYRANGERHIGRVLARENDVVSFGEDGSVLINGATQNEEIFYPTLGGDVLTYPYTVPKDCLFVLGDDRAQTKDSRDFGAIPMKDVEAKVITILRRRGV